MARVSGLLTPVRQRGFVVQSNGSGLPLADDWEAAFLSGSEATLRDWFSRNTGPRVRPVNKEPLTGEVGIASQWDADRLEGRIIRDGHIVTATDHMSLGNCWVFLDDTAEYGVQVPYGAAGVELHHLYLDAKGRSHGCRGIGGGTAGDVYAHHIESQGFADGLRYASGGVYEYIYVNNVMRWGDVSADPYDGMLHPHIDGSQFASASIGGGFTLRRSFIEALPGGGVVSAVIMGSSLGPISDVTIEESYFNGGNFTIRDVDPTGDDFGPATNVMIRDNMFAPGWATGGGLWDFRDTAGITRVGNRWMRSHRPVPLTNGVLDKPADDEW